MPTETPAPRTHASDRRGGSAATLLARTETVAPGRRTTAAPESGFALIELAPQRIEERLAATRQLLFQPSSAVAFAARPRLGAVLIFAAAPVVRILHTRQLKILLPIRALF